MTDLIVPGFYKRRKGALNDLGAFCQDRGRRALIIGGKMALEATEEPMVSNLKMAKVEAFVEWYGGECTWGNINRLADMASDKEVDLIIGVGGGKVLDTAKAVAYLAEVSCITVPTIAATCAAYTPLSIIYDDQGVYLENSEKAACPEGIFIDPDIIVRAPEKWLYSGIGDTLAKWYELRATTSGVAQSSWTIGGSSNGRVCYDIIKKFGPQAQKTIAGQGSSEALDYVIDAIIYYAGICSILGGEKFRGAAAHSIYMGFTQIPGMHNFGHGLLVGFGNLCLLALEGRNEREILEEIELARECGIPIKLKDIGVFLESELKMIADFAIKTNGIHNMPIKITSDMIVEAIKYIDNLSTKYFS